MATFCSAWRLSRDCWRLDRPLGNAGSRGLTLTYRGHDRLEIYSCANCRSPQPAISRRTWRSPRAAPPSWTPLRCPEDRRQGPGGCVIFAWPYFWPVLLANSLMAVIGNVFGLAVAALMLPIALLVGRKADVPGRKPLVVKVTKELTRCFKMWRFRRRGGLPNFQCGPSDRFVTSKSLRTFYPSESGTSLSHHGAQLADVRHYPQEPPRTMMPVFGANHRLRPACARGQAAGRDLFEAVPRRRRDIPTPATCGSWSRRPGRTVQFPERIGHRCERGSARDASPLMTPAALRLLSTAPASAADTLSLAAWSTEATQSTEMK